MLREPKSFFVKVRCNKCKNEQIIFSHPSTEVKCLVCGEILALPTGGRANINAQLLETLK